jgi:hypothetical protein
MIPRPYIYGYGRTSEEELAEPASITLGNDGYSIVLAMNEEETYGVYIDEEWQSARSALLILEYLQQHEDWLREHDKINVQRKLDEPQPHIAEVPEEQRPPQKAWQVIQEMIARGEAKLVYEPAKPYRSGVYRVVFAEGDTIKLKDVGYHKELGLYDKTLIHPSQN